MRTRLENKKPKALKARQNEEKTAKNFFAQTVNKKFASAAVKKQKLFFSPFVINAKQFFLLAINERALAALKVYAAQKINKTISL